MKTMVMTVWMTLSLVALAGAAGDPQADVERDIGQALTWFGGIFAVELVWFFLSELLAGRRVRVTRASRPRIPADQASESRAGRPCPAAGLSS